MRFQKAMLVFRKDWHEIRRNWLVILPIVIIPLIFSVLLPLLIALVPRVAPLPASPLGGLEAIVNNLPAQVRVELAGMSSRSVLFYLTSLYFLAPFFLIIPLVSSSVIASDSFAGEKERRTIEALLATPISDSELFLGKILVAFIPSMIVTMISFLIYSAAVDFLSFSVFNGRLLLPNITWILLIFGLAPSVALATIGLTVMISAKVKGFKEAQQISVLLLLPILLLMFGQISGAIIFGPAVVAMLIGVFAILDLLVFRLGLRLFRREEILAKLA